MEVYICEAYVPRGYCYGSEYYLDESFKLVIVANSLEEALDLALDRCPDTSREHWDVEKVDRRIYGVQDIL